MPQDASGPASAQRAPLAPRRASALKALLLAMPLLAGACADNGFSVEIAGGEPVAAVLDVCDSETPLRLARDRFEGRRLVDCEGFGEIRVGFAGAITRTCPLLYVASSDARDFDFVVDRESCREKAA